MGNLGFQEILIIGIVVLVWFGGKNISVYACSIGNGIREFNDAKDKTDIELQERMKSKEPVVPLAV